ncbi:hypothetical protein NDU88_008406, partial [Pleurodeles waltl]
SSKCNIKNYNTHGTRSHGNQCPIITVSDSPYTYPCKPVSFLGFTATGRWCVPRLVQVL